MPCLLSPALPVADAGVEGEFGDDDDENGEDEKDEDENYSLLSMSAAGGVRFFLRVTFR